MRFYLLSCYFLNLHDHKIALRDEDFIGNSSENSLFSAKCSNTAKYGQNDHEGRRGGPEDGSEGQ